MWVGVAGSVLLWLALAAAPTAAALLYLGERLGRPPLLAWGRRAFWALVVLVLGASVLLDGALVGDDFRLSFVYGHSSVQTPLLFRLAALWGGQRGSLLLWLTLLCLYGAYLLAWPPREGQELLPYALAVIAGSSTVFVLLVAAVASPFALLPPGAVDGVGLNRLLHNGAFLLHPVVIYLGFVGFTVPFAFAMAGLLRGETGDNWIRVTHRWALTAWALLSAGILLGAHWSYHVLGWGGYWSFDPVENAALLPWLLGTAFIHSALVQERRGLLKLWNASLVSGTYILTLFGTFLTRSGIVQSVHTFAESSIGGYLLAACGLTVALAVYLIGSRLELLADERRMDSLVSKEGAFLLNNVVFLSLALTVLVGTLVPVLSPYFGPAVSVGAPYFERVSAPLFTVLLLLAGVGPLVAWRRAGAPELARHLLAPLLAAAGFAAVLASLGLRPLTVVVGLSCAFFAVAAVLYDFGLGVQARRAIQPGGVLGAAWQLVARNPRRYGGYLVHVAMAVIAAGVVGSQAFQRQYQGVTLAVGQTAQVGNLGLTYEGLGTEPAGAMVATYARVQISSGDRTVAELLPALELGADAATEAGPTFVPAIAGGPLRDIYVVFMGYTADGALAGFNVFVNPLVLWIWVGGALLVAGALFSLWPRAQTLARPRSSRVFGLWSELEYDHRMGKVTLADYQTLRARYAAEASEALRREREDRGHVRLDPRTEAEVAGLARQMLAARPGSGAEVGAP